jgi:hypothetical protein
MIEGMREIEEILVTCQKVQIMKYIDSLALEYPQDWMLFGSIKAWGAREDDSLIMEIPGSVWEVGLFDDGLILELDPTVIGYFTW